jgi:hypothetical protein
MEFRLNGTVQMTGPNGTVELYFRCLDATTVELKRVDGTGAPLLKKIEFISIDEITLGGDGGPLPLKRIR